MRKNKGHQKDLEKKIKYETAIRKHIKMILENIKFGDKFKTRDGRTAIVIGEHKNARTHFYDFLALEDGVSMLEATPYKFSAYYTGIAFEKFEWLDIVEKL